MTHLRLEQHPGESLFQRVKRLLQACCGHMSQDEMWEVLSLRCPSVDGVSDFLGSEEAQELLADRELSEEVKTEQEEGEKVEGRKGKHMHKASPGVRSGERPRRRRRR